MKYVGGVSVEFGYDSFNVVGKGRGGDFSKVYGMVIYVISPPRI